MRFRNTHHKRYLVRKNYILKAGIKRLENPAEIIPFELMSIKGTVVPKNDIVLLTEDEIIELFSVFQTSPYKIEYKYSTATLPTKDEVNALYQAGWPVKRLSDGANVVLGPTPPNIPGVSEESVLISAANDRFEVATWLDNEFIIDTRTADLEKQIAETRALVDKNIIDIAALENFRDTIYPLDQQALRTLITDNLNRIDDNSQMIQQNTQVIGGLITSNTHRDLTITSNTNRIASLENTATVFDNTYSGTAIPFTDHPSTGSEPWDGEAELATITGSGGLFDFTLNRIISFRIINTVATMGVWITVTAGAASDESFTLDDLSFAVKIDTTGKVMLTLPNNNRPPLASMLISFISQEELKTLPPDVPTKSEFNNLEAKVTMNTSDIASNKAGILTKQDESDSRLTTSAKTIVGAINELKTDSADVISKDARNAIVPGTDGKVYTDSNRMFDEGSDDVACLLFNRRQIRIEPGTDDNGDGISLRYNTIFWKTGPGSLDATWEDIINTANIKWQDITATYFTRTWSNADVGKHIRITTSSNDIITGDFSQQGTSFYVIHMYMFKTKMEDPTSTSDDYIMYAWYNPDKVLRNTVNRAGDAITKFEIMEVA